MTDEKKKIAVIGSGTMGNGIAHVFAQNGFSVALTDISATALEQALETISRNLDRQVSKGSLEAIDKEKTLGNIRTFSSLAEGVAQADLVVEAATERIDLKLQIFNDLDTFAPPMPSWPPIPLPFPLPALLPPPPGRNR